VDGVIEELKEKYPDGSVSEYLEEVRHHILDNLDPSRNVKGVRRACGYSRGRSDESAGPERIPFAFTG